MFRGEFFVFVVVAFLRPREVFLFVFEVPVGAGVVEADADVVFAASVDVVFDEVAIVHFFTGVPSAVTCGPEAVTIVMTGGEDGVAKASVLCGGHPLVRVVIFGVPTFGSGE